MAASNSHPPRLLLGPEPMLLRQNARLRNWITSLPGVAWLNGCIAEAWTLRITLPQCTIHTPKNPNKKNQQGD